MKHGKRPTRAQKIRLTKAGLNPDNWLVITDHKNVLVIVNKESKKIKKIGELPKMNNQNLKKEKNVPEIENSKQLITDEMRKYCKEKGIYLSELMASPSKHPFKRL